MDQKTINKYQSDSKQFIEQYEGYEPTRLFELVKTFFISGSKTLDLGCASGRDLKFLLENKFKVDGMDPVPSFVEHCRELFPDITIHQDGLPLLDSIQDKTYKNILCSAVLMHLKGPELIESVSNILRVTEEGGRIIVTVRNSREEHQNEREEDGRLFHNIPNGKLVSLFEGFGAKLLFQEDQVDPIRSEITWHNFIFEKINIKDKGGIDSIQEIIVKDKKDTSYKLALLRSLIQVSKYENGIATYDPHHQFVYIPLKRIAFYWLKFYFPLLKHEETIRQSGSHPNLAFQKLLMDLPYTKNELTRLLDDYDDGTNQKQIDPVLKKIKTTIYNGPMKYIGSENYETFQYLKPSEAALFHDLEESELGVLRMPVNIWHDMMLFGHWIEDSILIEWAKFTERINKDENFPLYFKLLSDPIEDERTTSAVRSLFKDEEIHCVYSGLKISSFQVDHVIPYSIWKNNDLWNLLPSTPELNLKKSACIPSPELIKKRKELIIHYWSIYQKTFTHRFSYQVRKALGTSTDQNWENKAFLSFYETISRLSVSKVADTWYLL